MLNGQSKWPWSSFSRVKKVNTDGLVQHLVLRIPRAAFRQSAMTFGELKASSSVSRYWNMNLQLFLETIKATERAIKTSTNSSDLPDIVQKVYLEWIPREHDENKAEEYRLHAFLFEGLQFNYGATLNMLLNSNDEAFYDSLNRTQNSRKPDTLSGVTDYQLYKKVTKEIYFRNLCGLSNGHRRVENNLDSVSSHKTSLAAEENIANPIYVWNLKNACLNCKNPNYRNPDSNYVNGQFTFQDTNRLIRLCEGQLYTKTFLNKFLPDYQGFIESHMTKVTDKIALPQGHKPGEDGPIFIAGKDEPVRQLDDRLDMDVYNEHDISTMTEQEQQRIEAFHSNSDFQACANCNENQYIADCQNFEGTREFRPAYDKYQKYALEQLKSRCLNADATISEKAKIMIKWMERRNPPNHKRFYKYDVTLSIFANRVIKIMEDAEQFFLISTAHREFYQLMHARYDAYRRDFGLHLNIFQTGEGATSKSFLFDLMKSCSIPGTIDQLTYETAKANAVDGNRNDTITLCHEAPPGMFRTGKNRNMDSGMEAMFKERLTSNTVSCKTFCFDEATGKRSQRVTKSECIGVWFGATNDPQSEVEEALKTRFHWGNFEKIKRPGKDIDDCINGERALSRQDKLARNEIILEWQEEQARIFLIEKMIWCGVIKDVEMSAFYAIKQRFKKLFDGKSVKTAETRDWQRIWIFARIQAICTALTTVFQAQAPAGHNCYNKPFEIIDLLKVEQFLICTEEMVYFTLTMMDSQFVHPSEHKILRKIWCMQKNNDVLHYGNPTPDDTDQTKINYNYIKITGKIKNIAANIQNNMGTAEGKTSTHNIEAYLFELTEGCITSKEHEAPPIDAKKNVWPEENRSSRSKKMKSAEYTGDALYIHVKLLKNHQHEHYDPVLETIQKIQHSKQREKTCIVARRKYFSGNEVKEQCYHIFRTIERIPIEPLFDVDKTGQKVGIDKNIIKYVNVLHNSRASRGILMMKEDDESRQNEEILINMDLDAYAAKKREETLALDNIENTDSWGIPTPGSENYQGLKYVHVSYPNDMLEKLKSKDDKLSRENGKTPIDWNKKEKNEFQARQEALKKANQYQKQQQLNKKRSHADVSSAVGGNMMMQQPSKKKQFTSPPEPYEGIEEYGY